MGSFDIGVGQLAVLPSHLQAGVPQHSLEAKDITTIAQELYGCCMTQGMR